MMECVAIKKPQDLLGVIVVSKQGRDKDKPCIILGWLPGDFALVADGRRRTVAKPKKKNMKHLIYTQYRPEELAVKFQNGDQVTDRMIREELAAYNDKAGKGLKRDK